jgi:hypothetical protein
LTNGRDPEQSVGRLDYGGTASFSVVPGRWKITVKAFTKDDKENLVAEGTQEVDIKPGPNGDITIPMRRPGSETPPEEIIIPIMVTSNSDSANDVGTLRQAIQTALKSSRESETIVIDLDAAATTVSVITLNDTLPNIEKKSITIRAKNPVTIKRNTNNPSSFTTSFFTIGNDGTLTLGGVDSASITIDGGKENTPPIEAQAALIHVTGPGEFIMNDGVTLQNNKNNGPGGGVFVDSNSEFIMNGGTISGNYAFKGGGVWVADDGYFDGGTFKMINGIIYGNESDVEESLRNTDDGGAGALQVNGNNAIAEYGIMNGGWKKNGDLKSTDNTIKVEKGELKSPTTW